MAFSLPGKGNNAPTFDEIFNIPDSQGDTFVLKLSQSVAPQKIRNTLDTYVVTNSIEGNLNKALGYVRSALDSGENQGVYLDGSFGSGKSHFMAVLYAILANYPEARSTERLQGLIVSNEDLVSKNYLQLTFHFLGSKTIEGTIFSSYLKQIAELHPETTPPMLHADGALFDDALGLRARMGDEAFFAALNEAEPKSEASVAGGFDLAAFASRTTGGAAGGTETWNAQSFDQVISSNDPLVRQKLAQALTKTLFQSHTAGSDWVSLPEGLKRIADHAATLGHEAVVLYLDELILWLMFMTPSSDDFRRESQKLTQLVENDLGKLPIPVISFIARQKDLAAWASSNSETGSDQAMRQQSFAHQEGRFNRIELGNKNLPAIAHERLLKPKDEYAKAQLDTAFHDLNANPEVLQVLLNGENTDEEHSQATVEQFQLTYPFSPALVDTLTSLSSVMQRERTALKVMENLLIDQRSTGTIGTVIPVGDAFDYLITGTSDRTDDAASERFREGLKFWDTRLRPVILGARGVDQDTPDSELSRRDLADIRLGKTLMLSALAPNVPALKNLTARRLASLNHGSMVTMFASDTAGQVVNSVKQWAAELPEISIQDGAKNPMISLVIDDVPWQDVMASARPHDTAAKRRERVRNNLKRDFGVEGREASYDKSYNRTVTWRGTDRQVEIVFGNVRNAEDLTEDDFRPSGHDALRIVVDYPFDEPGHTVAEDHRRVEELKSRGGDRFTIVWMPQFFDNRQMDRLGDLVVSDYVTTPSGLKDHTQRIAADQVAGVETKLKSKRDNLSKDLEDKIKVAYGISAGKSVEAGQEPIKSLDASVNVNKPVGSSMKEAVDRLITDAFDQRYPDHPRYDVPQTIRPAEFNKAATALRIAAVDSGNRAEIAPPDRRIVRNILSPLRLAEVYDAHLVFSYNTVGATISDIDAALRNSKFDPESTVAVRSLQEAIRNVNPNRGLTEGTINLIVCAWAALKNRSWFYHNKPMAQLPSVGEVDESMELRPVELPDQQQWEAAIGVYSLLSGNTFPQYLTGDNLRAFQEAVVEYVDENRGAVQGLSTTLAQVTKKMRAGGSSARVQLIDEIVRLFDALSQQRGNPLGLVELLAGERRDNNRLLGATHEEAINAIATADQVNKDLQSLLTGFTAGQFDRVIAAGQARPADEQAKRIVDALAHNLGQHQLSHRAENSIRKFEQELSAWLDQVAVQVAVQAAEQPVAQPPAEPEQAAVADSTASGAESIVVKRALHHSVVNSAADVDAVVASLKQALSDRPGAYRIIVAPVEES